MYGSHKSKCPQQHVSSHIGNYVQARRPQTVPEAVLLPRQVDLTASEKNTLYETRRVKRGPRQGVGFSIGLKLQNFAVWPAAQSPECTRVVHYAVYVDVHTYRHILHFLFHTATIQTQLSFYFCIVSKPRLRCQSNRCPQATPSSVSKTGHKTYVQKLTLGFRI